jgi:hypothetical protein
MSAAGAVAPLAYAETSVEKPAPALTFMMKVSTVGCMMKVSTCRHAA